MRALFITSIPGKDIGGPSLYAANLPQALRKLGIESRVIRLRPLPKIACEIMYLAELFTSAARHDIIYSLSGSPLINIPALLCAKIFGKKFVIRPGGDFLWERAIERGATEKTPREFYASGEHEKQKFSLALFRWTLHGADKIIFPTLYLRNLYQEYFAVSEDKCSHVDYPFPDVAGGQNRRQKKKQFIFAGRLIKFKNGERLIRAFAQIADKQGATLRIIGKGPEKQRLTELAKELGAESYILFEGAMEHASFLGELKGCYCAIIPSIFEPGSFSMLECLKLGVPVIFTKESGLCDAYKDTLVFIDPYSISDIRNKIEWLLDEANYKVYTDKIARVDTKRSWDDTAREHKMIFEKLVGRKNKRVLFIGVTEYDLTKDNAHLQKKFEGLSKEFHVFTVARGAPFYARKWNSDFYLIKYRPLFLPVAFVLGFYLCVSKRIDGIVCQTPLSEGMLGVILKMLFRSELIVEVHGDWEDMPFLSRKRMLTGVFKKIAPSIAKFSFRRADKIRTLTNYFADRVKKIAPGKKYFVFPTYTDIDYFLEETNTSFRKYILTVGVLSPIKNIETLIDAFARTHNQFPDFKLVIAGDGPSLENYKLQTINYKLEDKVIFTGKLSTREVREAMKDCYVFVLPSLSEGFGRVFIEAMALAKPVIGSNVGGIPEIIKDGENGFLIEPKDAHALAEKLRFLLARKDVAERMGRRGREFCESNFSNKKYIENFRKLVYSR